MRSEFTLEHGAWKMIDLPVITERRGNLTFIEGGNHIPFDIARVYYLYDVPGGSDRGGHAHKKLQQLLIAISGSFDVHLDNGKIQEKIHLARGYYGVLIGSGVWRVIDNFSTGSTCLVLASLPFEEADYYRDYQNFLSSTKNA